MKINVIENGVAITRDMTPEEEREHLANLLESQIFAPTEEDRLQALESAMLELIMGG